MRPTVLLLLLGAKQLRLGAPRAAARCRDELHLVAVVLLRESCLATQHDVGEVLFAGQALNFCVANTMVDIIKGFSQSAGSKVKLIRNCTSSVPGFQQLEDDFLNWFTSVGGQLVTI